MPSCQNVMLMKLTFAANESKWIERCVLCIVSLCRPNFVNCCRWTSLIVGVGFQAAACTNIRTRLMNGWLHAQYMKYLHVVSECRIS